MKENNLSIPGNTTHRKRFSTINQPHLMVIEDSIKNKINISMQDKENQEIEQKKESIKFGDLITIHFQIFKNEHFKGTLQSNILPNSIVKCLQQKDQSCSSFQNCIFQIVPKTENNQKTEKIQNFSELKEEIINKQKQEISKDQLIKNKIGYEVCYGEDFLLKHFSSDQYIQIDMDTLNIKSNTLQIILIKNENKNCQFSFLPSQKTQILGHPVTYTDFVLICQQNLQTLYLNMNIDVSKKINLEASTSQFDWTIQKYQFNYSQENNFLRIQNIIRIQSENYSSYLIANNENQKIEFQKNPKNKLSSYWTIKSNKPNPYDKVNSSSIYLKNILTKTYLGINENKLIKDKNGQQQIQEDKNCQQLILKDKNGQQLIFKKKYCSSQEEFIKQNDLVSINIEGNDKKIIIEPYEKEINLNDQTQQNQTQIIYSKDGNVNISNQWENSFFNIEILDVENQQLLNLICQYKNKFKKYSEDMKKLLTDKQFTLNFLRKKSVKFENLVNNYSSFIQTKKNYLLIQQCSKNFQIHFCLIDIIKFSVSMIIDNQQKHNIQENYTFYQKLQQDIENNKNSQSQIKIEIKNKILKQNIQFCLEILNLKIELFNDITQEIQPEFQLFINLSAFFRKICNTIILKISKYFYEQKEFNPEFQKFTKIIFESFINQQDTNIGINSVYKNLKLIHYLIKTILKFRNFLPLKEYLNKFIYTQLDYIISQDEQTNQYEIQIKGKQIHQKFIQKLIKNKSCFDLENVQQKNSISLYLDTNNKKSYLFLYCIYFISIELNKEKIQIKNEFQNITFLDIFNDEIVYYSLKEECNFSEIIKSLFLKVLKEKLKKLRFISVKDFLKNNTKIIIEETIKNYQSNIDRIFDYISLNIFQDNKQTNNQEIFRQMDQAFEKFIKQITQFDELIMNNDSQWNSRKRLYYLLDLSKVVYKGFQIGIYTNEQCKKASDCIMKFINKFLKNLKNQLDEFLKDEKNYHKTFIETMLKIINEFYKILQQINICIVLDKKIQFLQLHFKNLNDNENVNYIFDEFYTEGIKNNIKQNNMIKKLTELIFEENEDIDILRENIKIQQKDDQQIENIDQNYNYSSEFENTFLKMQQGILELNEYFEYFASKNIKYNLRMIILKIISLTTSIKKFSVQVFNWNYNQKLIIHESFKNFLLCKNRNHFLRFFQSNDQKNQITNNSQIYYLLEETYYLKQKFIESHLKNENQEINQRIFKYFKILNIIYNKNQKEIVLFSYFQKICHFYGFFDFTKIVFIEYLKIYQEEKNIQNKKILRKIISSVISIFEKQISYNQISKDSLYENFNIFYQLMKLGFQSQNILVHLIIGINDDKIVKKIIDQILKEYVYKKGNIFPIFNLWEDNLNQQKQSQTYYDENFGFIEKLNLLFINLIKQSDLNKSKKWKKKIFFTLLQQNFFDKMFSFINPTTFKKNYQLFINSIDKQRKETLPLRFLGSLYDLLTELIQENQFAIRCLQKIASYEKIIFVNFVMENFYFFKGRILKIFQIVHFNVLNIYENADYLSQLMQQVLLHLEIFPSYLYYFIEEVELKLNQQKIPLQQQNFDKKQYLLQSENEYWQMLLYGDNNDQSQISSYGLLYFIRDFLQQYGNFLNKNELNIQQNEDENQLKIILKKILIQIQKLQNTFIHIQKVNGINFYNYLFILNEILFLYNNIFENKIDNNEDQNNNLNQNDPDQIIEVLFVNKLKNYLLDNKINFYQFMEYHLQFENMTDDNKLKILFRKIKIDEYLNKQENQKTIKDLIGGEIKNKLTLLWFFAKVEALYFKGDQQLRIQNQFNKYQFSIIEILKENRQENQQNDSIPLINNVQQNDERNNIFILQNYNEFKKHILTKEIYQIQIFVSQQNLLEQKIKDNLNVQQIGNIYTKIQPLIFTPQKQNDDFNMKILFSKNFFEKNTYSIIIIITAIYDYLNNNIEDQKEFQILQQQLVQYDFDIFLLETFCDIENYEINFLILKTLNYLLLNGYKECQEKIYKKVLQNKNNKFFVKLWEVFKKFKEDIKISFDKNQVQDQFLFPLENNSFFEIDKKTIICQILKFLQNLCENCQEKFQKHLCHPENVHYPINFVKKITNFYADFCEMILLEQQEKNNLDPFLLKMLQNEDLNEQQQQDMDLLKQTYNTMEDFMLGPCIENIYFILSNNKFIEFINKILNLNFDKLQFQKQSVQIFIYTMRILSLLVLSLDQQIPDDVIDLNQIAKIMKILYQNYIQKNKILIKKDIICQGNCIKIKCNKCQGNSCRDCEDQKCTFNECLQQKLSLISQDMYEIGFICFKILKKLDYEHLQTINQFKKEDLKQSWFQKSFKQVKLKKNNKIENKYIFQQQNSTRNNKKQVIEFSEAIQYFSFLEGSVELIYKDKLVPFEFQIPQLCFFKKEGQIQLLIEELSELHHTEKIKDLLKNKLKGIQKNMKLNQQLYGKNFLFKLVNLESRIFLTRYFMEVLLNLFLISVLYYDNKDSYLLPSALTNINHTIILLWNNKKNFSFYIFFCFIIYITQFLELIIQIINNKTNNFKAQNAGIIKTISYYMNFIGITNLIFILIQLLAFFIPWLWSLILLEILNRNTEMRDIVKSITENYKQLLKTVLLAMIVLYIYSFIAFSYFPQDYVHDGSTDFQNYCNSLFMCFSSTFFNGIRAGGGIGEAIGNVQNNNEHYWFRLIFDLSFFIFVSVCLMNIVFGTIIDAFAALRDKRKHLNNLINNNCFICEFNKLKIENHAEGWYNHINQSHSLNNYLRFFIYLEYKEIQDCNSIEKYVKQSIINGDYKFVPYLNCYSLRNNQLNQNNKIYLTKNIFLI